MADDDKSDKDREDTEHDEEEDDFTPPDKEQWERTTTSLKKANDEAKKWRLRATGKDEKWEVPGWQRLEIETGDDKDKDGKPQPPKVDVAKERREAEEAALAKIKPGLVSAAARDALRDAGLLVPASKDKAEHAIKRALRLIDLSEVEVDEDGSVSGVEDQVRAVKRDYPELFARKGSSRVDAGAGSNGDLGKKSDTSADKIAALLRGQ
jgi:hypothetical protein